MRLAKDLYLSSFLFCSSQYLFWLTCLPHYGSFWLFYSSHVHSASSLIGVHIARAEAFFCEVWPGLLYFLDLYTIIFALNKNYALTVFIWYFLHCYFFNPLSLFLSSLLLEKADRSKTLSPSGRIHTPLWTRRWRRKRRAVCCVLETLQMPRARMLEKILDQTVSKCIMFFRHKFIVFL